MNKMEALVNDNNFEEIKALAEKRYMTVDFEGTTYYMTQDAYADNYQNEPAVFTHAVSGETDESGNLIIYRVRWDYIEAEDLEDCADWDSPVDVTRC
jgi:hypothetical protein